MDEMSLSAKIIDASLAAMAALVLWFTKRSVKQYDDRIAALEIGTVKTSSLDAFREQLAEEHATNTETLRRIEDVAVGSHERIDDLFKFIANR